MRKLMLFVCSICICVLSSFSNVFANNEYIYGYSSTFFGKETCITDSSISSYSYGFDSYDIQNFYKKWYDGDFQPFFYDDPQFLNSSGYLYIKHTIVLPEVIPPGQAFDVDIKFYVECEGTAPDQVVLDSVSYYLVNSMEYYNDGTNYSLNKLSDNEFSFTSKNAVCIEDDVIDAISIVYRVHDTQSKASCYVTDIDISENSNSAILNNIFDAILDLPDSIASSFDKFFHSDDPSINENESLNDNLNESVTDYDELESGFVDDFNSNISSIDTNINMFQSSDFITTSNFLSNQMTTLYSINPNIQNMITFSLIIGLAFVVIGIGVKR